MKQQSKLDSIVQDNGWGGVPGEDVGEKISPIEVIYQLIN